MGMKTWQADFYRRPLHDKAGHPLWELLVCTPDGNFTHSSFCPQPEANSAWLTQELQRCADAAGGTPQELHVFRPQSLSLLDAAGKNLGITVVPTRRTPALKQYLEHRAQDYPRLETDSGKPYQAVTLEKPPPVPLPEALWGEQWRFAAIAASDLLPVFQNRPIPVKDIPADLLPMNLQLPSTVSIPGVIIDAGRSSMQLTRWLQAQHPVSLNYIPGEPDGLILEAGLVDRWIVATFTDPEVVTAAQNFRQRQQDSQGLHFLLVQPDDSGMTYSGFWLLQVEPKLS